VNGFARTASCADILTDFAGLQMACCCHAMCCDLPSRYVVVCVYCVPMQDIEIECKRLLIV
jgi:hypothetical protein